MARSPLQVEFDDYRRLGFSKFFLHGSSRDPSPLANAIEVLRGVSYGARDIPGLCGEIDDSYADGWFLIAAIKVLAEREDTPVIDLRGIVHDVCLSQHLQNVTLIGYVAEHVTDADGSTSFYVEPADKPGIALLGRHTIYGPRDVVYEPLPMR